jgi:hypothetical protein
MFMPLNIIVGTQLFFLPLFLINIIDESCSDLFALNSFIKVINYSQRNGTYMLSFVVWYRHGSWVVVG